MNLTSYYGKRLIHPSPAVIQILTAQTTGEWTWREAGNSRSVWFGCQVKYENKSFILFKSCYDSKRSIQLGKTSLLLFWNLPESKNWERPVSYFVWFLEMHSSAFFLPFEFASSSSVLRFITSLKGREPKKLFESTKLTRVSSFRLVVRSVQPLGLGIILCKCNTRAVARFWTCQYVPNRKQNRTLVGPK